MERYKKLRPPPPWILNHFKFRSLMDWLNGADYGNSAIKSLVRHFLRIWILITRRSCTVFNDSVNPKTAHFSSVTLCVVINEIGNFLESELYKKIFHYG